MKLFFSALFSFVLIYHPAQAQTPPPPSAQNGNDYLIRIVQPEGYAGYYDIQFCGNGSCQTLLKRLMTIHDLNALKKQIFWSAAYKSVGPLFMGAGAALLANIVTLGLPTIITMGLIMLVVEKVAPVVDNVHNEMERNANRNSTTYREHTDYKKNDTYLKYGGRGIVAGITMTGAIVAGVVLQTLPFAILIDQMFSFHAWDTYKISRAMQPEGDLELTKEDMESMVKILQEEIHKFQGGIVVPPPLDIVAP